MEYLQDRLNGGAAASSLSVYASAINAVHPLEVFSDKRVKLFLKGAFNLNPPVRDPYPSWNLAVVLQSLAAAPFEPIRDISLKLLTIKTAFLVAITSARRGCELQALDCRPDWCKIRQWGCVLRHNADFLPKVATVANIQAEFQLPLYRPSDPNDLACRRQRCLCVTRALKEYVRRTSAYRREGVNQLFVCYGKQSPGEAASKASIARWISKAITLAYETQGMDPPTKIKAHSTRKMAASTAYARGIDFSEIAQSAMWAGRGTFVNHYQLHLSEENRFRVANTVLTL